MKKLYNNLDRDRIYHRQLDLLAPSEIKQQVIIIGSGSIGSTVSITLVKMGFPDITIYDDDRVEEHNLPNQFFRKYDNHKFKVVALKQNIIGYLLGNQKFSIIKKKWQIPNIKYADIIISAVDSMTERHNIWNELKNNNKCQLYIDGRMVGELMRIYSINPNNALDIEFYEKTLYSSREADKLPCTAQSIFYNCFVIAGLVGNQCKKFVKKEPYPKEIIFDLKNLQFLTQ